MRIASLLPAATEWIAAIGAADKLVARSHECDFPEEVLDLPVVTSSTVPDEKSGSIDRAVRTKLERGLSLFEVDVEALRRLQPDLVLTQTQCAVCAISTSQLQAMLGDVLDPAPELFAFDPHSMKEVLEHALRLGRRLDRQVQSMAVVAEFEKRLQKLQARAGISKLMAEEHRSTVACIEWLDPLMTSGNWVPDVVRLAGGSTVCAASAERSAVVPWEEIRNADPDVIAVMPCGFSIPQTKREFALLSRRPGWGDLRAVRRGAVFLFDGRAYFNRPGPRLYRSIELLISAIHGTSSTDKLEPWEVQHLKSARQPAG